MKPSFKAGLKYVWKNEMTKKSTAEYILLSFLSYRYVLCMRIAGIVPRNKLKVRAMKETGQGYLITVH